MPSIPPIIKNVNHASYVVILGAGASIASYMDWGSVGPPLPSMQNLIEKFELKEVIEQFGYNSIGLNFEAFYDELSSKGKHPELLSEIERKTYSYFSHLTLPDKPTIYDYLVLSLREKDIIATFNWDPFLVQAFMRNEVVTKKRRPRLAFLHGNVFIGICEKDRISGINGRPCSKCGKVFAKSKLLYPVKQKDYNSDIFIKGEWDAIRWYLEKAYFLTIFGYSAPKTDIEARSLLLEVWNKNKSLELAEVEVVDIAEKDAIEKNWEEFFFSHHYMVTENIFNSYLFQQPRRSCDAFAEATLMCRPWHSNPFPRFETLAELQEWVKPLIDEERDFEENETPFSGKFLPPNKGDN